MAGGTHRRGAKQASRREKLRRRPFLFLGAWVIWFLVLWYLSSGPIDTSLPDFLLQDKLLHWGYFTLGSLLLSFFILNRWGEMSRGAFILLLLIGIAVGVLDEWHQSWVPGRFGNDPGDLLADSIGTLTGLIFSKRMWRILG